MSMDKEYVAVIQAGGRGTRLTGLTKDRIPKPLLGLNGKPMIEWQIENLKKSGVKKIYIICGYLGEMIQDYFGDGEKWGVNIDYIIETKPLGSAGALYYLKQKEIDDFILVFGDVMFDIDFEKAMAFHEKNKAILTLFVHPNNHPYDSDVIILDDNNIVKSILSKNDKRQEFYYNMVNAGIYIVSKDMLKYIDKAENTDLEKDLISKVIMTDRVYGYHTAEYMKDTGTVERFLKVEREQQEGIWKKRSSLCPQKAVFLDRDGTINKYNGLICSPDQMELEEGAADAVKTINELGYLAIVVTNQPVVARGMCSIEDVNKIHRKLSTLLGNQGAYLDDIVFCPHHPDKGFPEENKEYKIICNCRKPNIGMINLMADKYNIDLSNSYIVGDTTTDIKTGENAGMKTILVKTGQAGTDGKYDVNPDYVVNNILEAALKIKDIG